MDPDRIRRGRIFEALTPSFGKIVTARFLRNPGLPDLDRIHPLIEGIYKPAWSNYALSISSMLQSQYSDQTYHNPDGTWWIHYSPKTGGMELAQNAALVRCMTDSEPVLVIKQVSGKASASGARHRILGLGLVEDFDVKRQLFRIRGVPADRFTDYIGGELLHDRVETALRLEALEEWRPFEQENRALYKVNAQRRDQAFRDVVLENYDRACAVTGQKFVYTSSTEADAAHIIPKKQRGTDDPRNGLALCKSIHWAFDIGVFTISDQYEVIIHPEARRATFRAFPLMEKDRKPIYLPPDPTYNPHPEALAWHREERFGLFTRTGSIQPHPDP